MGLHKRAEISLNEILDYLSSLPNYHKAGAVASFVGVVREDSVRGSDARVTRLEYEAYPDLALRIMGEIRNDMLKRQGIIEISIHHVVDVVSIGEPSLFVTVLGEHRQDVFPVLSDTVDRLKAEVPIWKKEFTTQESHWVSNS